MKKFVCVICGYVHEGESAPDLCPQCKAPASKFKEQSGEKLAWADEHRIGAAAGVDAMGIGVDLEAAALPRLPALVPAQPRALVAVVFTRKKRVRMLISLPDRTLELLALLDSGNLLTEPLSGLPVVVVKPGLLPLGGRPVPYRTMDSTGFLYAIRPISLQVDYGGWLEVDAFLAESPMPLDGADAIIDSALLTQGGICTDAEPSDEQTSGAVPAASCQTGKTDLVHPFRRDAAATVPGGGGAGVDQSIDAG